MSQSGSTAVGTGAGAGNDDNDDGSDEPLLGGRAISNLSARSGWSADDDNRQVFLSISSHGSTFREARVVVCAVCVYDPGRML